ncbi:MAG TPA: branched-chain amino acid ABC transporter permease [Bacillota bacterium]|nr:branched-chain amino acid ABC transporter permease [Bacillota bacterium]HOA15230.1 branched-chain amino acid ABC transporter permease [Bacillota bacterium]HOG53440.1 branched-chain amino acid ABC transporter permease [Bacillota bacterium]
MQNRKLVGLLPFLALALAIVAPLVLKARFQQHVLVIVVLYAVMSQAWNIMAGYAGMVSVGQAAFFGLGAYISTVLFVQYKVNPWIGFLAAGLGTALFATIIGLPFSRLKGRYFAIGTIALAQMIKVVFENWPQVGGATGIIVPMTKEGFWNFQFHSSKLGYYYIVLAMLVLVVAFIYFMERSKMGFYFKAIRENEEVATGLGVNKTLYKLIAIAISAGITGMCGTILAQYILYAEPSYMFDHTVSVTIALIAVFGGSGNIVGPIIGSVILMPISELTRAWLGSGGTGIDLMIYGAFIVLMCVYEPDGLTGIAAKVGRRLKARREGRVAA